MRLVGDAAGASVVSETANMDHVLVPRYRTVVLELILQWIPTVDHCVVVKVGLLA